MIKSILLPLVEGPHWPAARDYAFWLAEKEGSRVHGLALIDVKAYEMPVIGTADGFMPSVVAPPVTEAGAILEELTATAREHVAAFDRESASRSIPSSSDIKTGIPGEIVAREAIAHDVVVMARAGYERGAAENRVDPLVQAVIRGSSRPVLVSGPAFREVRRILVAYDGSVHAARALAVAAELASRPGVQCMLGHVSHTEAAGQEALGPAEAFLRHHGVLPEKKIVLGAKASEQICDMVTASGADLLVMGAYGHRPIREMLFGSTTERVLSHCGASVILQS